MLKATKATDKMKQWKTANPGKPWFALEFFPPKTDLGIDSLYELLERMALLNPLWINITWAAGGTTSDKTLKICMNALKYHGVDVMMHLTCTNMDKRKVHDALVACKEAGIVNILALRGDAPKPVYLKNGVNDFIRALDLVKYIKEHFGDTFCVAVAGNPEGHPEAESLDKDIEHLKEKVDAGADLVVSQYFYSNAEFFKYVDKVREAGVTVPIIPGVMPIPSYTGFSRMTQTTKMKLPTGLLEELEPIKEDSQKVKDFGATLAIKMCSELVSGGAPGFHFYTLNLEPAVTRIVTELGWCDETRQLPWRKSTEPRRRHEEVRPVYWLCRPVSYLKRTSSWEVFPLGRLSGPEFSPIAQSILPRFCKDSTIRINSERLQMWGSPSTVSEVGDVIMGYLCGNVKRLPWRPEKPSTGTELIVRQLIKMNRLGLLTINWLPQANGTSSCDHFVGWGEPHGLVYQKSYLEFFVSPENLDKLLKGFVKDKYIMYIASNKAGDVVTNTDKTRANAVTWGVFPGREIQQPLVTHYPSFLAWKDEAFALWNDWIGLYPPQSSPWCVLDHIQNRWHLVSILDDNFTAGDLCSTILSIMSG